MNYTKKQLLQDVTTEANRIKRYAKKSETKRLYFINLRPQSKYKCVYGQMTGNCTSTRAAELIQKCCVRFFKMPETGSFNIAARGMSLLKENVNGEKVDGFVEERTTDATIHHFSAIEAYIMLPNAKNENLIKYIKGETDKLVL